MSAREIIETLKEISAMAQDIGDKLRALSEETDDVDVVSLISSLSLDAYDLSVDIQESVDTYEEILEEDAEEEDSFDFVDEIDEEETEPTDSVDDDELEIDIPEE